MVEERNSAHIMADMDLVMNTSHTTDVVIDEHLRPVFHYEGYLSSRELGGADTVQCFKNWLQHI